MEQATKTAGEQIRTTRCS